MATAALPSPNTLVAASAPPAAKALDPRRVIAFVAMVFGMFMAILDIQIVSASLARRSRTNSPPLRRTLPRLQAGLAI